MFGRTGRLCFLHRLCRLHGIHLLLQTTQIRLRISNGLFQAGRTLGKTVFHFLLRGQTGFILGNFSGNLSGQCLISLPQRRHGIAFILCYFALQFSAFLSGELLLGHNAGQLGFGLLQLITGFTYFLIQNSQCITIGDRFADFVARPFQGSHNLSPDTHCNHLLKNNYKLSYLCHRSGGQVTCVRLCGLDGIGRQSFYFLNNVRQ